MNRGSPLSFPVIKSGRFNEILLACEQALLFGQAKRALRERASEGALGGFAARSRVLARLVSLAQIGELARRLRFCGRFS